MEKKKTFILVLVITFIVLVGIIAFFIVTSPPKISVDPDKDNNENKLQGSSSEISGLRDDDQNKDLKVFITEWTTNTPGETITLPYGTNKVVETKFNYDFEVDWGDGNSSYVTTQDFAEKAKHRYSESRSIYCTY